MAVQDSPPPLYKNWGSLNFMKFELEFQHIKIHHSSNTVLLQNLSAVREFFLDLSLEIFFDQELLSLIPLTVLSGHP